MKQLKRYLSCLYQKISSQVHLAFNLVLRDTVDDIVNYWTLNPLRTISTDIFEGLQIEVNDYIEIPEYSYSKSDWVNGDGDMRVTPSEAEEFTVAWKYQGYIADNDSAFVGTATSGTVRDEIRHR